MPLILILVLAALLILQFMVPRAPAPRPVSGAFPRAPAPVAVAATYVAPSILAHPIFTPTRGVGGGGTAASSEPQLSDYTLVGVTRTRGFASATLSGPGGKLASLRPGQAILGWRLEAITGDTVTFGSGGERRKMTVGGQAAATVAPVGVLH